MKVAVETERIMGVAIANAFRRGRHNRDAHAHGGGQPVPTFGENARRGHFVVHDAFTWLSSASRSGDPTSFHKPACNSPPSRPASAAFRSNGPSGALWPAAMPSTMAGSSTAMPE